MCVNILLKKVHKFMSKIKLRMTLKKLQTEDAKGHTLMQQRLQK